MALPFQIHGSETVGHGLVEMLARRMAWMAGEALWR